ncbi:hypothetical protein ANO11243_048840 [Dothideomycetidae sp. 11243]|nr:hypothetical protein ANO11243_048840 [fungal sp. No.11243]
MTQEQIEDAIELGEKLATGQEDLVALDERSLSLRGKKSKSRDSADKPSQNGGKSDKRKADDSKAAKPTRKKPRTDGTMSSYFTTTNDRATPTAAKQPASPKKEHINPITNKSYPSKPAGDLIRESTLTPFRKQVLTLLSQVPRGQYTTYAAMSAHISDTSHKTCARAVGNAMRNNPFAPVVPCHRVLAADGRIGGFGGDWGEDGKHAAIKKKMLREEGVKFDGSGKVVGPVFKGFQGDGKK